MSGKSFIDLELAKMKAERDLLNRRIENMEESALPPQGQPLIQGYTAEQWQEIIDGGYLCEFSFQADFKNVTNSLLFNYGQDQDEKAYYFHPTSEKTNDFTNCRPAQIKGVMRPIFVEPVDKEARCVVIFDDDSLTSIEWSALMSSKHIKYATKYIEL